MATFSHKTLLHILLSLLVLWVGYFVWRGHWVGDFFDHWSVLRELVKRPWNPLHPVLGIELPHAFFSPYMVLLGAIGHATGLSAFGLLSAISMLNLLLLIWGGKMLIDRFYPDGGARFYLRFLLLSLLAWGGEAWFWSSFYHLKVLPNILPYPATFAFVCSIFSWQMWVWTKEKAIIWGFPAIGLAAVSLLAHPTTYMFFGGLMLSEWIYSGQKGKDLLQSLIAVMAPIFIVGAWPYFPFWELILGEGMSSEGAIGGSRFHQDSLDLYKHLLWRCLPFLVLPIIRKKYPIPHFILWPSLISIGIYTTAFFLGKWGFGRLISFVFIWFHVYLVGTSLLDIKTFWPFQPSKGSSYAYLLLMGCMALNLFSPAGLFPSFLSSLESKPPFYQQWAFLEKYEGERIMVDTDALPYVNAFGPYTQATTQPPYWVKDIERRLIDTETFFKEEVTMQKRMKIVKRYQIRWVLIHQSIHADIDLSSDWKVKEKEGAYILYEVEVQLPTDQR
ncbi:MAG: hypothetical protein AAFY71_17415 [Bacteroidota bacterium]